MCGLNGKVRVIHDVTIGCVVLPQEDTSKPCPSIEEIDVFDEEGKWISRSLHRADGTYDSTAYHYNDKGQLILEEDFNNNLKCTGTTQDIYNDNGTKREEVYVDTANRYKTVSKYNDKGDMIEDNIYNADSTKKHKSIISNKRLKWTIIYNSLGQLAEAICFSYDKIRDTTIYKYDHKGNRTEIDQYFAKGSRDIEIYNHQGNCTKQEHYDLKGHLTYRYTFKYDKSGNNIKWVTYNQDGTVASKVVRKFDKHSNKTEEDYYKGGSFDSKIQTQYEYDKIGNWIKKTLIWSNGTKAITIRTIEYY